MTDRPPNYASRHPIYFLFRVWALIAAVAIVAAVLSHSWIPGFVGVVWGWIPAIVIARANYTSPGRAPATAARSGTPAQRRRLSLSNRLFEGLSGDYLPDVDANTLIAKYLASDQSGFTPRQPQGPHVPWRIGRVTAQLMQDAAYPDGAPGTKRLVVSIETGNGSRTLLTVPDGPQQPAPDWTARHPGIADPEPARVRADLAKLMAQASAELGGPMRIYSRSDPRDYGQPQFWLNPAQRAQWAELQPFVVWAQEAINDLDGARPQ